ncbi:ATPase [Aureococcus anophagefferens]|nr:ATPase [Aureococcus anophagefferens]
MGCVRCGRRGATLRAVVAVVLFRIASSGTAPRVVVRSGSTAVEFASIEAAIDELRRTRSSSSVVVEINGTHYLQQPPLALGGLEDVTLRGGHEAVVSAGSRLDDDCWIEQAANVWSCALPEAHVSFRTLMVGGKRASRARTPDARDDPAAPEQYFYANQTSFVRDDLWALTLATSTAEPVHDSFRSSAMVWPHSGWNNFEATLQSASNATLDWLELHGVSTTTSTWFELSCPAEADKNCTGYDGKLAPGARLYAYGSRAFLTDGDEWARDGDVLYLYSSMGAPRQVVVPRATTVIAVESSKEVVIESVTFSDTDARYLGFQNGFSVDAESIGIPTDAALHVSGSSGVQIENCVFSELGGGGVTATSTTELSVSNSTFAHLGQSGVALVGNGTTRTTGAAITNNSMTGVGEVFASAGGVFLLVLCARGHLRQSHR